MGGQIMDNNIRKICKTCKATFVITAPMVKKIEDAGYVLPERCKSCNEKKKRIKVLTCKECKGTFNFNLLEEEALRGKYDERYKEPNFCPKCRTEWRNKQCK
jgi:hypothetical protein